VTLKLTDMQRCETVMEESTAIVYGGGG